jgi:hypothetical protein
MEQYSDQHSRTKKEMASLRSAWTRLSSVAPCTPSQAVPESSGSSILPPASSLPVPAPDAVTDVASGNSELESSRMNSSKEALKPQLAQSAGSAVKAYKTICEHGRRQTLCVPCKGGSICEHGKQRGWCIQCGGTALCSHGRQKSRCAECGGKGLCMHGKVRRVCSVCHVIKGE